MKKIVFICTGNICRSPMGHHYMQKRVIDKNICNNYLIDSCGTYASTGDRATKNAIEAMKKYDVNMQNHRAKHITEIDLNKYDLIVCLTQNHKTHIALLYPSIQDRVFTLKEYVNPESGYKDIDDPWGLSMQVYEQCASEIVEYVDKLIEKF